MKSSSVVAHHSVKVTLAPLAALEGDCSGDRTGATDGLGGSSDDGANRRPRFRGGLDFCLGVGLLRTDGDLAGELDGDTETLTILRFTCVGRDLATAVDGPAVS